LITGILRIFCGGGEYRGGGVRSGWLALALLLAKFFIFMASHSLTLKKMKIQNEKFWPFRQFFQRRVGSPALHVRSITGCKSVQKISNSLGTVLAVFSLNICLSS